MDIADVKQFLRKQARNAYRLGCDGVRRTVEWYRRPDVQARREDLLDRTRARLNQGRGVILNGVASAYRLIDERLPAAGQVFTPERLQRLWQQLSAPGCARVVLGVAAGAGGAIAGSAFPDLDIRLLGIGSHRNWFFHSGIATYALGKVGDKMIEHYQKLGVEGDDSLKAKAIMELERYVGAPFISGFALGQSIHLGLDALVHRGKDVLGFPVEQLLSGGRTLDSIYLLGNGLWAFSGAGRFVAFAVTGEPDTERLLDYLRGLKSAKPIPSPGAGAASIWLQRA